MYKVWLIASVVCIQYIQGFNTVTCIYGVFILLHTHCALVFLAKNQIETSIQLSKLILGYKVEEFIQKIIQINRTE